MDLDGLEKIMVANHTAIISRLDSIEDLFREQVKTCCARMETIEKDVDSHDKVIQKSKGVAAVIGAIWAAVTATAALIAPYFWR